MENTSENQIEKNKLIIGKLFDDVLNRNKPDTINVIVAKNYFEQDLLKGQEQGRKGVEQRLKIIFDAFPDAKYQLEDMITEKSKVAVRWIMTGTQLGEFMNIPATGKLITLKGIDIYEIKNDMIITHWNELDLLGLVNQLKDP